VYLMTNIIIGDNLTVDQILQAVSAGEAVYCAQFYTDPRNGPSLAKQISRTISNNLSSLGSTVSLDGIIESIFQIVTSYSNLGLGSPGRSSLTGALLTEIMRIVGPLPSPLQICLLTGHVCNLFAFATALADSYSATAFASLSTTITGVQQNQLLSSLNQTLETTYSYLINGTYYINANDFVTTVTRAIASIEIGISPAQLQMMAQGLCNLFYGACTGFAWPSGDWSHTINDTDVIHWSQTYQIVPHIILLVEMILALTGGLRGQLSPGLGGFAQNTGLTINTSVRAAPAPTYLNMTIIIPVAAIALVLVVIFGMYCCNPSWSWRFC
jgi:hypothetical protein